ncbi:MAG: methyltransferase domain-containing protein [Acidobacteriaceae bacterium]|nr:methyltransferase domain-containing protein [Acidobacteriaceae bacterium]
MPRSLMDRVKRRLRISPSFGDLGNTKPFSTIYGYDRGTPIDRYYIENFLTAHASDVCGRTLEIGDDTYTSRFGGTRTTQRDVLHLNSLNPAVTIVGDLSKRGTLPASAFDCLVITQTLYFVYDIRAAVDELYGSLKSGGILLLTTPGIFARDEEYGWFWSLTTALARRLFGDVFGADNVEVGAYGNVFAATAFLQGIALEEVPRHKLDVVDEAFPVVVTVRARK